MIAVQVAVATGPAPADGAMLPFGEFGRIAMTDEPSFRLETKNDSVGLLSRRDWDDFRSYGVYGGVSLRNWALELSADGLTSRALDDATRGRIDEVHASVLRRVFMLNEGMWSASLNAGAGAILLGRFGMEHVQKDFHTVYGNFRPIPENYDNPEHLLTSLGEGIAQVHRESDIVPVDLSTSLEIAPTGFFRIGSYADATLRDGFLGTDVFAGMEWATGYASQGPSYENTLDSEKGCIAGANFRIGFLEAGYAYNISTERNAARLSVSFGGDGLTGLFKVRKRESSVAVIDAIEIGAKPFLGAIRLRKNLPATGPLTPSVVIGGDSDYFNFRGHRSPDNEIYQFEQAFAGIEAAVRITSCVDVFGMGAGGARKERHRTRTIGESIILDEKNSPVFVAESGIRFRFPCRSGSTDAWGVSVAGGADFAEALDPGIHPYFQVGLFGESPRRIR